MMTTVAHLGEVGLIQRLARRLGGQASSVLVGIGDDAAVLRLPAAMRAAQAGGRRGGLWLFASDMLVEGLYDGLARCARRFGVSLVGGDTVRAPVVVVDVAILGMVTRAHLVRRSGARVGDRLFVTGRLGGSLSSGRHATFVPRVQQAQWLVRHLSIHAMIDLSDGLGSDLWQIARASRVTLQVREADIPLSRFANTTWQALMDGEDFELLFAVPAPVARRIPKHLGGVPITDIGVVSREGRNGVELMQRDGRRRQIVPQGFRHF